MKNSVSDILEKKLKSLKISDGRNAAEHAYALAVIFLRQGNRKKARQYGQEAITLFDQYQESVDDYTPRNVEVGGIVMPSDFIHSGVVRDRLKSLAL